MFCPRCGKQNKDDAKFCNECGSALEITTIDDNEESVIKYVIDNAIVPDGNMQITGVLIVTQNHVSFIKKKKSPGMAFWGAWGGIGGILMKSIYESATKSSNKEDHINSHSEDEIVKLSGGYSRGINSIKEIKIKRIKGGGYVIYLLPYVSILSQCWINRPKDYIEKCINEGMTKSEALEKIHNELTDAFTLHTGVKAYKTSGFFSF